MGQVSNLPEDHRQVGHLPHVPPTPDPRPLTPDAALRSYGITHIYIDWAEIARYRSPGNYGYSPAIVPQTFRELVRSGVLGTPLVWRYNLESLPTGSQQVFREWNDLLSPGPDGKPSAVFYALYSVRTASRRVSESASR